MDLIEAMEPAAQKDILAAPGAVWGLANNGQAQAVERIRQGWAGEPAGRNAVPRSPQP